MTRVGSQRHKKQMHIYVPCFTLTLNCKKSLFGRQWTVYHAFRKDEYPLPPQKIKMINVTKFLRSLPATECCCHHHSTMQILNTTHKTSYLVAIFFICSDRCAPGEICIKEMLQLTFWHRSFTFKF
jgi:hypothetical protein